MENTKESKLTNFFKDRLNILALLVISFAIIIRLYYLFLAHNQPLWWDEAELMLKAKSLALNTPDTGLFPYREPLLPMIWGLFFKIGASEFFIRFIQIIFSIAGIIFTYLMAKEIFDKKVAIITTTLLSFFYLHLFYSIRFMSEAPTLAFFTIGAYYFWKGYINSKSYKYLIISGASISIGFLMYYAVAFLSIILGIFLLFIDKFRFLKSKYFWTWAASMAVIALPYVIYSLITLGTPLPRLTAVGMGFNLAQTTQLSAWNIYLKMFPVFMQPILFYLFIIALIYVLINVIIGFDLIFKDSNQELKKEFFLILCLAIPIIILSYIAIKTAGHGEDRYLTLIFPAAFMICAVAIIKISKYIDKIYNKAGIAFIILLILIVGAQQIIYTDSLIKSKIDSYQQIRLAGLWIKQYSSPGDTVFSNSIPQNTYYSERATYFDDKDPESIIKKYNTRYVIWSVFEASGNPNSALSKYLTENQDKFIVVNAYFADAAQQQPLLYILQPKSS